MTMQLYRLSRLREKRPDLDVHRVGNGQSWQAVWTSKGVEYTVTRHALSELLDHLDNALNL